MVCRIGVVRFVPRLRQLKKIDRQEQLGEHPHHQKNHNRNRQQHQKAGQHASCQIAQPQMPWEFCPGYLALPANVFAQAVLVASVAFDRSATGGTDFRHGRTVQKIGGFPLLLKERQAKCTCDDDCLRGLASAWRTKETSPAACVGAQTFCLHGCYIAVGYLAPRSYSMNVARKGLTQPNRLGFFLSGAGAVFAQGAWLLLVL